MRQYQAQKKLLLPQFILGLYTFSRQHITLPLYIEFVYLYMSSKVKSFRSSIFSKAYMIIS